MTSVQHVARYIVEKMGSMTTMKLQKLTYYCQAWSLAWDGEPLFEEDFQAWANGPVCVELFKEHRGEYRVSEDFLKEYSAKLDFNTNQIETMDAIIRDYGDDAPYELSELTHKERPWKETRGSLPLGASSNQIISKDLMQEYYGGLQ